MARTATCSTCGTTFDVPENLKERYPGWTPSECRDCYRGRSRTTRSASRNGGRVRVSEPAGGDRRVRASASEPAGGDSPADVLERFTSGPLTGVFTDGSADPNPGPGGWGAVYVRDDTIIAEAHGHEPDTTNNRMELTALIAGYDLVPPGEATTVYSDSNYCVRMINEWAAGWAHNGWRRKTGPVKNLDLVKALYERARARPELKLQWIKAHDGSRWNEYADALSVAYRRG